MNCTICNKPVVLVPSAKARAAKDMTGKSAAYYTKLFPQHAKCILKKRAEEAVETARNYVAYNDGWTTLACNRP